MFNRIVTCIILIYVIVIPVATAQPASPCSVTTPANGVSRITVDARTGQIIGAKHYVRTAPAEIVVINKNPFRYSYKLDVEEELIAEPGLDAFLPIISSFTLDETEDEDGQPNNDLGASAAACPEANLKPLRDEHMELGAERTRIENAIEDANRTIKGYQADRQTLASPNAVCETLYPAATRLQTSLTAFTTSLDLARLEKDADVLEMRGKRQLQKVRELSATCAANELDAFADRAELLAASVAATLRKNIATLKQAKQALEEALRRINDVLAIGPTGFTQYVAIGEYDLPTEVTLTFRRKDDLTEGADFAEMGTRTFSFGGPARFTLGVGVGGTTIERTQYERIQGYAVGRDGSISDELTTVIGETESSGSRVTPLLMLHGRLWDARAFWPATVQFSVGVSAKADNVGTHIEYLVGPSIGLLDDRLFITAGAYGGGVQTLQGNLHVGEEVPDSLTEIPVRKELVWKFGVGLTYKLR